MLRVFLYIFLVFLFSSCAKISPLEGGFKDTLSPVLIYSNPPNKTTNYDKGVFYFEFDERIDASNLSQKLIVSPFLNNKPELKFKKNTLYLTFDSTFSSNTTYILNFADGVEDVTEGNPAKNTRLVFSTGSAIDSSFVGGVVYDPLKNEFIEGVLVALYDAKDSLPLFIQKPLYFSFSDKEGRFYIENIRVGKYKLFAFQDENGNFIAEPNKEMFGYTPGIQTVDSFISEIKIPLFKEDPKKIKIERSRERGLVYELTYSKKIKKINVISEQNINYSLNDNNLVRFYKGDILKDSIFVVVEVFDSLLNSTIDSLFVVFNNKNKRTFAFSSSYTSGGRLDLDDTLFINLSFSKPLDKNLFSFYFLIDSTLYPRKFYYLKSQWNKNLTSNKISLYLVQDSIKSYIKGVEKKLKKDSLLYENDSVYLSIKNYYKKLKRDRITLVVPKGSVVSVEKDTLTEIKKELLFRGKEYYGSLSGKVVGVNGSFFIQLVSENMEKTYMPVVGKDSFLFKNIEPGKYYIKIIKDVNKNKKWDYGSILKDLGSEEIIYYKELIEIRSNWSIEDLIIEF